MPLPPSYLALGSQSHFGIPSRLSRRWQPIYLMVTFSLGAGLVTLALWFGWSSPLQPSQLITSQTPVEHSFHDFFKPSSGVDYLQNTTVFGKPADRFRGVSYLYRFSDCHIYLWIRQIIFGVIRSTLRWMLSAPFLNKCCVTDILLVLGKCRLHKWLYGFCMSDLLGIFPPVYELTNPLLWRWIPSTWVWLQRWSPTAISLTHRILNHSYFY